MRIGMAEFGTHLTGRLNGIKNFGQVCTVLSGVEGGEEVILDFSRVAYASASWLSAVMLPLHRRAAEPEHDFYPLVAKFPSDSVDDLKLVAEQARLPFLLIAAADRIPVVAQLAGVLDPAQQETLRAVEAFKEVTGAELAEKRPDLNTKGPAWNNRLRDLFEKRLLRRRKQGREQIYAPVVPEVILDG